MSRKPLTAPHPLVRVRLETPSAARQRDFLSAVRRSSRLHDPFVQPASTALAYRKLLERARDPRHCMHLVCTLDGELAGVINISEIVRGGAQFGYLGYYAFEPYAGQGYMRAGLLAVLRRAFGRYQLHRVEANIQPANLRSAALVRSLGFRKEGFSPKYLKIRGRYRDHDRWACTVEDWRARPAAELTGVRRGSR